MPPSFDDAPYLQQQTHADSYLNNNNNDDDDEGSVYSKVEFTKQLAQSSLLSDDDAIPLSASQFGIRPRTLFDHDPPPPPSQQQPQPTPPTLHVERRQRQRQHKYPLLPPTHRHHHLKQIQPTQNDDDADQADYKFLVRHLQKENEQLLIALQRSHDSLVQCRLDKRLLEDTLQNQRKLTLDQELQKDRNGEDDHPTTVSNNDNWNKSDMEALVEHLELQHLRDAQHRNDLLFQKRYLLLANSALESCEQESLDMLQQLGVTKADPAPSPLFKCRACVWTIIAVRRFQSTLLLLEQEHGSTSRIKSSSSYSVY